MLFNSLDFLLFFPVVTALYYLVPFQYRWLLLLVASCIFYMAFVPVYILVLFFTIGIDYFAGILIEQAPLSKKKPYLILSILANVGVLAVFKYYNFFIDNVNELLHHLHITTTSIPLLNILLPIGLSFHTFQAMSYTIEVYRGNQKTERHLGIYALYVMFYPQLVAGPIERPQNLLHQFREEHKFDSQNLLDGLRLMLWGFFKKLVIADRVAQYVNPIFNYPAEYHWLNLVIATLFFAIQIYCDFSGYSDIAIGAAKTMGFDLMTNFNRPYFSRNIQEFWKRWHISLSTWFRDYVYISLGGNRVSIPRFYFNVAIVFLISGLWHGANWTFLVWGALQAMYMLVYMILTRNKKHDKPANSIFNFLSIAVTFLLVCIAWIFFRANNLSDGILIAKNIFTLNSVQPFQLMVKDLDHFTKFGTFSVVLSTALIAVLFLTEAKLSATLADYKSKPVRDIIFCTLILCMVVMLGVFSNNSFIYFQF